MQCLHMSEIISHIFAAQLMSDIMKSPISRFLKYQNFVVLDGALATELEQEGADLNDDLWSAKILMQNPELIYNVHRKYLEAGADIITTASYQATFEGYSKIGIDRKGIETLFRRSVRLAEAARKDFWEQQENRVGHLPPLIAASIGPYGAFLADGAEYTGAYGKTVEELKSFHKERAELLASTNADLLLFETIPSVLETQALVELTEELNKPSVLSFTCRDDQTLWDGTSVKALLPLLESAKKVVALGFNCTAPHYISNLIKILTTTIQKKSIWVYPNSGERWDGTQKCWLPDKEGKNWLDWVEEWLALGANCIGGCCRTRPEDIQQLRSKIVIKE